MSVLDFGIPETDCSIVTVADDRDGSVTIVANVSINISSRTTAGNFEISPSLSIS